MEIIYNPIMEKDGLYLYKFDLIVDGLRLKRAYVDVEVIIELDIDPIDWDIIKEGMMMRYVMYGYNKSIIIEYS